MNRTTMILKDEGAGGIVGKRGESRDSPGVDLMPPVIFYVCIILGGALEYALPSMFVPCPAWLRIMIGLVLLAGGFMFMMKAHGTFESRGTNVETNRPATMMITGGAYEISRNPMYVGGMAILAGLGVALGSWWLLGAVAPLALYLKLYVVPREEAYMERAFGAEYQAYRARVRRWV